MYLAVTLAVLGEASIARSAALVAYWVAWFVAVNLVVIGYEEPALRRQFGAAHEEYTRRPGRWIPAVGRAPSDPTGPGVAKPAGRGRSRRGAARLLIDGERNRPCPCRAPSTT